ncbi:MAG TPA: CoA-disulfide reductase [Terriglobales bacterium]|nr:CoA-disulfide reductase [Terriglobales bacterium]
MKIIIIGGNPGGMSAAARLMRKGKDVEVVVFEKTNEVSYGACGLPYYIGGENDDIDKMRIRKAPEFIDSGVDLRLYHEALSVDAAAKTVTVKNLKTGETHTEGYDKLIVATGAASIRPPLPGADKAFALKTLEDGERIKEAAKMAKRAVIVGGGYIGLELAEAFRRLCIELTVIEAQDRVLPGFDPEFSKIAQDALIRGGVDVKCGERVEELGDDFVATDRGRYPSDLTVLSVGVRPATGIFAGSAPEMLKNGAIVTNEFMETSLPDVYAAGDCATVWHAVLNKPVYLPLGTNANKQGRVLADRIAGGGEPLPGALGSAMLRCFDRELARTGVTEAEAAAAGLNFGAVTVEAGSHARYYPGSAKLTVKLVYDKSSKVLLGAQMAGEKECALRIDTLAVAIDRKMTARELAFCDLAYAPPFASVWDAVQQAAGVIK